MSRNIFLITGKPGSGKTTLSEKIWNSQSGKTAGYRTFPYEKKGIFSGYEMENLLTGERQPISRKRGDCFEGIEETFAGFGTNLLKEALSSDREVIILDELGRFEKDCKIFIDAVWEVIRSEKTVCLILKKEPVPYIEEIIQKSGGLLIDLDETGRERAESILKAAVWQSRLSYTIQVRLYLEEKSFGPGPMRLLKEIEKNGSLSHSAKAMGMAYSKAWTMLKKIEKEWGFPLLKKQAGGNHGGGSELTKEGKELLMRYEAFCADIDQAAREAMEKHFDSPIFL